MAKTRNQIIAGALYQFAASLTTGPNMQVGRSHVAGPMAEAVHAFCKEHGLYAVPGSNEPSPEFGEPAVSDWKELAKLLPAVVNDKIDPEYAESLYGGAAGGGKARHSVRMVKHTAYGVPANNVVFARDENDEPVVGMHIVGEDSKEYRKVFKDMLSKYIDAMLADYKPNEGDVLKISGIQAPRFLAQEIVNERPQLAIRIEGYDIERSQHYVVERGIAPRMIDENGGMTNIRCDHCFGCTNPSKCATNIGVARCDGDHGMPVCDDPGCWQK